MIILELCCIISQAQTPFDKFLPKGKTIPMLELKEKPIFRIENPDTNALLKYGEFIDDKFYFYGKNDNLLLTYTLTPTDKKWLSRDPKESQFPDKTPYGFVSGNPINRIDPDGQADYYLKDGTHAGNDGVDDNRTMTTTGVQEGPSPNGSSEAWRFNGANDLNVGHDEFLKFAGAIHIETSGDKNESYAIGTTTVNKVERYDQTIMKQFKNGYFSSSLHEPGVTRWKEFQKSPTNDKFGLGSAINAYLYKAGVITTDLSNGATHWDGRDLLTRGISHYRYKPHPLNPSKSGISVVTGVDLNQYLNNVQNHLPNKTLTPVSTVSEKYSLWEARATYGQTLFFYEK